MKWPSEQAMFRNFQAEAEAGGWLCHPETCGHDLILVAGPNAPVEPGRQIVVEGKLTAGLGVLAQALPPARRGYHVRHSADWYAVLVPAPSGDFRTLASALSIRVIEWEGSPRNAGRMSHWSDVYQQDVSMGRLPVADVRLDVAAGAPSPRGLSPWKLDAVRACLLGRVRPVLASELGSAKRWLVANGCMARRSGRGASAEYVLEAGARMYPDEAYPEVVAALARSGWTVHPTTIGDSPGTST